MARARAGLLVAALLHGSAALDNRVADTPPRGWCSWQRYRCHIACNDSTSTEVRRAPPPEPAAG